MRSALLAALDWLKRNESVAIWLEGIALVLIFIWDRKDRKQDHAETIEQMKVMSASAQAAQKSAEVTEASLKLQRVAMDQWVDTEEWSATSSGYIPPGDSQVKLLISFHVTNPTKFKLTFRGVELWMDRKFLTAISYGEMFLAPAEYAIIETSKSLTETKFTAYRDSILRFEIGGRIRFVDAFDVSRERNFGFLCDCRKDSQAEFTPIAFTPPDEDGQKLSVSVKA